MIATSIISSIRQCLGIELLDIESLATDEDAIAQRGRDAQVFSDDHLLELIATAENEIMLRCDACRFPGGVLPYTGSLDPLDPDILRILPNRVFRDGVRCVMIESDHTSARRSERLATAERPVSTYGGGVVRIFPDSANVLTYVVMAPPVRSLTDVLGVDEAMERAIIGHVAEACYEVLMNDAFDDASEGAEIKDYIALAQYWRQVFESEISPWLRGVQTSRANIDNEIGAERAER